jgi:hypothetical protein
VRSQIPKGHPFRKVRNYYEIWPFKEGIDDFWLEPDDLRPPRVTPLERKESSVEDHPAAKYFDYRLHDALMIAIEVNADSLALVVNDYDVWRLGTALRNRIGARGELVFPVSLEFSPVNAWAAFQTNPLGRLTRLRHSLRSNLAKPYDFHRDCVLQWDPDRIVAFFEIIVSPSRCTTIHRETKWPFGRLSFCHSLLVSVDAEKVTAIERQREAWITVFGEEALPVIDAFLPIRERFVHGGFFEFENLVDEVLPGLPSEYSIRPSQRRRAQ